MNPHDQARGLRRLRAERDAEQYPKLRDRMTAGPRVLALSREQETIADRIAEQHDAATAELESPVEKLTRALRAVRQAQGKVERT